MRKFIICVDYETTVEINAFVDYLKRSGHGWWHRTSNSWAIVSNNIVDLSKFRDDVVSYFPKRRVLVVDLATGAWGGWGTKEEFQWFTEEWK